MENYFSYLNEGEHDVTLKNAKRIILELCDNNDKLRRDLKDEVHIKNTLLSFILSKGLLDDYHHFKSKSPMTLSQAAKVLAYSLE